MFVQTPPYEDPSLPTIEVVLAADYDALEKRLEEATALIVRLIAHAPIVAIQDRWDAEAFLADEKGESNG
jgi:hypothetical protein